MKLTIEELKRLRDRFKKIYKEAMERIDTKEIEHTLLDRKENS